jgi:hypothetical protein
MRIADALGDRPDMNIAVVNVPAVMTVVCGAAAGEFGHSPTKRGIEGVGKPSYSLCLKIPVV